MGTFFGLPKEPRFLMRKWFQQSTESFRKQAHVGEEKSQKKRGSPCQREGPPPATPPGIQRSPLAGPTSVAMLRLTESRRDSKQPFPTNCKVCSQTRKESECKQSITHLPCLCSRNRQNRPYHFHWNASSNSARLRGQGEGGL